MDYIFVKLPVSSNGVNLISDGYTAIAHKSSFSGIVPLNLNGLDPAMTGLIGHDFLNCFIIIETMSYKRKVM